MKKNNQHTNEENRKTKSENIKPVPYMLCVCSLSCYSNYGITDCGPIRICVTIWVEFIIQLMIRLKFCYPHTVKSCSALLRSGLPYGRKRNLAS